MTGAGSAEVGFTIEDEFAAGPTADPTWNSPGIDVQVDGPEIDRSAERKRYADDPRSQTSRPGDAIGTATVSFSMASDVWHDLVLADGGTAIPDQFMAAPSACWYFGADLLDGDQGIATVGTVVTDAQITYQQGEDIQVELTMEFADKDETIGAPGTIEQPPADDVYVFHGADLEIASTTQTLLQSATLSLSGLARLRRGQSQTAYDAVTGNFELDLSTTAVFSEADQLDLAYSGRSDAATIDDADGTLSFENAAGNSNDYALGMQPTTHSWSDLVGADDLTESVDWHVHSLEVA